MALWSTTQIPPPQDPVPPPFPVSVYLHRNVHESMDMNQTLQAVSVVLRDVLLLVRTRIVINLQVCVELYHIAVKKMVLQPTVLPVSVDPHQNVLLIPVYSVSNQTMVLEVVIKLLSQLCIQKLKVVHVVRCLEEQILWIKQRV